MNCYHKTWRTWLSAGSGLLLLLLLPAIATASWDKLPSDVSGELRIIHAGSLSLPFRAVSVMFNETYPRVEVLLEAHGSRDCARKVSDLGLNYDVMGSADYSVIDTLLIPEHAAYSIRFATNEMAIAFTDDSAFAEEISADNWPAILLRDEVAFGRADPNRDPCGYRTVMTCQLAEEYYGHAELAAKLLHKDGLKYIRPKETDLLALLEAGEIDYLFIYRSVAEQHSLSTLLLPDETNLKRNDLAGLYSSAEVELVGKQPGSSIKKNGAPMVYGVTIPHDCERRDLAEAWVELLLSPAGQRIMREHGQPSISPGVCAQFSSLPECLKPYCMELEE